MYLDCQSTFQVETIGFLWGEVSELRSILSAESYGFVILAIFAKRPLSCMTRRPSRNCSIHKFDTQTFICTLQDSKRFSVLFLSMLRVKLKISNTLVLSGTRLTLPGLAIRDITIYKGTEGVS
jgi:hypothetical protein